MTLRRPLALAVGALGLVACGGPSTGDTPRPSAVDLLMSHRSPYATGEDVWEVWLCDVPLDTTDETYANDPWRLDGSVEDITARLGPGLTAWWSGLSGGRVDVTVTPGGRVTVGVDGGGEACVEAATAATTSSADGLLVIATAAHRPDVPGGWGRPGDCDEPCPRGPAADTGRAVYVGAADLHPSWGDEPPLDLIQHEMGHALDLPHSGVPADGRYTSALDVMSDSAARRAGDATTRDAGGTLAVNLFALGWLADEDVAVLDEAATVDLALLGGDEPGVRLAVVPLDDHRLLTVEMRGPVGLDTHLPDLGVTVHLVDQSATACDDPVEPWREGLCTGRFRLQQPLVADPPFVDLLGAGDSVTAEGWRVTVERQDASTSRVALTPA